MLFLRCLLFSAPLALSAIIPQVPLHDVNPTDVHYGYVGTGYYRIVNLLNSYVVSVNDTSSVAGVVSM